MFVEHKEAIEITEQPAKVLKLSEAIRAGAKLQPECYGIWWHGDAACAMTAAARATGIENQKPYSYGLRDHFSRLGIMPPDDIWGHAVGHLNGRLKLPHSAVADWLEAQGY